MTVLAQAEPFCQAYFFLIYRWSILPAWISNFDHQSILQYKLDVRLLPYKIDHQYSFKKSTTHPIFIFWSVGAQMTENTHFINKTA